MRTTTVATMVQQKYIFRSVSIYSLNSLKWNLIFKNWDTFFQDWFNFRFLKWEIPADTDLKIILLDQNNYIGNSSMTSNTAKNFWHSSLSIQLNYFDNKIIFRSLIKFLDISAKLFFPCMYAWVRQEIFTGEKRTREASDRY